MQKKKKLKRKQTTNILIRIKERWTLILFALIIVYFSVLIIKGELKEYFLNNYSEIAKGVVINERNYFPNGKVSNSFSYSYKFSFNEYIYINDSQNKSLKIGDTVLIEFYPNYPTFSRLK